MHCNAKRGNGRESLLLRGGVVGSQLPTLRPQCCRSNGETHFSLRRMESETIFREPHREGKSPKGGRQNSRAVSKWK